MSGLTFLDYTFRMHTRGGHEINFQAARQDMSGDPQYFAWLSADGEYVFMEQDRTDSANITLKYFFAKIATEAFAVAWADRAGKTYVEYNALFT